MNQHSSAERLHNLLPAIYRIRDEAQGQQLKALLAIAAGELQVLQDDIDNLYENWFIETCDEWVVPYIGDLLDAQKLYAQNSINYGQQQRRAYVANTIAYRRRKGTAPVLEQLTRDITDWRARAVEFFQRLATTQNLNHLRPNNTTVDLSQSGQPEFLGTPFEQQVSYSINIGDALEGRGFHNIPNIGLYIWRLQSYPMEKATARMFEDDGRYYFSCLGLKDFPLFNQPQTETDILHLAEEINVPAKLRIPALKKELNQLREDLLNGLKPSNIGYFDANPVLEVFVDGEESSIPPENIWITALKKTELTKEDSDDWVELTWDDSTKKVAIDPESGRLAFPPSQLPSEVEVSYFYGFSGDIGGGSYPRNLSEEGYVSPREISQGSLIQVIRNWNVSVEVWKCLQQGRGVVLKEIFVGDSVSLQDYGLKKPREAEGRDNDIRVVVSDDGIITVKAGMVRDGSDNPIYLENDCQLDVSAFTGESLILFIAHQPGLGLPDLRVVSHGAGDGWLCLGVALKEVFEKNESVISITDNKTYSGDLTIVIPPDKTLKFMSADGFRPHLLGNLYVQGITPVGFDNNKKNYNPGEFILEGLLIEGKLTVLPGSLRSLHINHCTLVPKEGGLTVSTWEVVEDDDNNEISDDSWTLIAIAIYFLNAIRSLIGKGTPGKSLHILLKIAINQAQLVFSQFRELIQWRCVDEYPVADGCLQPGIKDSLNYQLDNSRLNISIYRSICGALRLADTVPTLLIEESIIDNGLGADTTADIEKLVAIEAAGTAVEFLLSSTVFGTTTVRSLEASDSIFTGRVTTLRKQIGCMRFCYLPNNSQTPRRYLCQPDKALAEEFDINKLPSAITSLTINKIASSHQKLIAGTAGKGVFSSKINNQDNQDNQNKWQAINEGLDNLNITALFYNNSKIYAGTIAGDVFRSLDNGNSWGSINSKEGIEPKKGTGTISSAGRIVKGNKTNFTEELSIGDIITAKRQKRIVTQIDSNYFFCVDTPFEPNLNDAEFTISNSILNTDITAFAVYQSTIFAATAGGGVFRFLEESGKWTAVNVGITNLNVTSLIAGEDGYIYAGTYGGVFRTRNPSQGWLAISFGLENLEITALTMDVTRQLFAGTSGGGVFRFDEYGNIWTAVNDGLSNSYITVMAASGKQCNGTVSSDGNKLNGENTNFTADFLGRSITAAGQTRTATKVVSPTEIIVDEPFCQQLPEGTVYSYQKFLVVGTVGGSIFYSVNSGETWQEINAALSDTDITDLVIIPLVEAAGGEERNNSDRTIFVGTTAGNILCSSDDMQTWKSLNDGLVNVEDKLRILSKIQPRFTSTEYGNPAYAQLSQNCAVEIRTGAEDGSEIGVFSYLKQPQRQANLEASLKEYLRFGLKVGIFYET